MMEKIKDFLMIWGILLVLNQVFIFHGCFKPFCLLAALPHTGVIAFLLFKFGKSESKPRNNQAVTKKKPLKKPKPKKTDTAKSKPKVTPKPTPRPTPKADIDPLKAKGNQYERFIGQKFEAKGELVIYNGFIKGYEDQGVDIISLSNKGVNLIQCKNWTKMRMTLDHMEEIYDKLDNYDFDCFSLSMSEINGHQKKFAEGDAEGYLMLVNAQDNLDKLPIRKTLYIASEKVVNLEIGPYLTMMSPTIFKFKDMKIVMTGR